MRVLAVIVLGIVLFLPAPSQAGMFHVTHNGSSVAITNNYGSTVTQTQSGSHNFSFVAQGGPGNTASTTQTGSGGVAIIIQGGSGNTSQITQH